MDYAENARANPFHTFIVRYRLEPGSGGSAAQWRGTVIHLPTDKTLTFSSAEQVLLFMQQMLEAERA